MRRFIQGRMGGVLVLSIVAMVGGALLSTGVFRASPAQASDLSGAFYLADVENGPNVTTTVRIFNTAIGSGTGATMDLFAADGGQLASCTIPIGRYQSANWCITPSDFHGQAVASLQIQNFNGGALAVEAWVTKVVGPKNNPQVIERTLTPNSRPAQIG